jgi:hypothetical protein
MVSRILTRQPRAASLGGACLLGACLVAGCGGRAVPVYNLTEKGQQRQWVWPYFLYEQPTVVAFWSTDEMDCYRNLPALGALDALPSSVQLVTVATGRDRLEIDRWIREKRIRYPVLLDLDQAIAHQAGVSSAPTFVYYDPLGQELERGQDIRVVRKWFDDPRWREGGESISPATARLPD